MQKKVLKIQLYVLFYKYIIICIAEEDIYGCIRNVVEDNEADEDVYAAMVAHEEVYQSVHAPEDKRNNVVCGNIGGG